MLQRFFAKLNESVKLLRSERTSKRFRKNLLIGSEIWYVFDFSSFKRIEEAFQGVKATNDTALKTGEMGLPKHRQATQLNRQNTSTIDRQRRQKIAYLTNILRVRADDQIFFCSSVKCEASFTVSGQLRKSLAATN